MRAEERETIIRLSDADDLVYVYSCQRAAITKMKGNPSYLLKKEGTFDGGPWAEFTIPRELFRFGSKRRVSERTAEQARKNFGWTDRKK